MLWRSKFASLLALTTSAIASIGPVADLILVNQNVAPDGFLRA